MSTFRDREVESILSTPHMLRMEGGIVLQRNAEEEKITNCILCVSTGTEFCYYYPVTVTVLWLKSKESDSGS